MTHKQRMLAGEPYQAGDPELVADRARARRLTAAYASTTDADGPLRRELLANLLGTLGADIELQPPFRCDYGCNVHLAAGTFVNYGATFLDTAAIHVAERAQLGPNVQLLTATHPLAAAARRAGWEGGEPITIRANAWLGGGVIVLPGVTVGADSVVGAGSVVTRDVPPGVVAAGNPCRVLRELPET